LAYFFPHGLSFLSVRALVAPFSHMKYTVSRVVSGSGYSAAEFEITCSTVRSLVQNVLK
jgi:hypothetical protein